MSFVRRLCCIALLAVMVSGAPARAQVGPLPVIDVSSIQQLVQQLQQMQQIYNTSVSQLTTLQNQYRQLLLAGQMLNPTQLSTLTNALNQIQSMPMVQTQIAGVNTTLLQNFQKDFPTYQPNANYPQVLATLNKNTNASLADAYNQMQTQNQDIQLEQNYLSQLLLNANSATGQMQALQAANGFLGMLNAQMIKLRQIQLAMLRNQSAFLKETIEERRAGGSGGGGGGASGVVTSTMTTQDTAILNYLGIAAQQMNGQSGP